MAPGYVAAADYRDTCAVADGGILTAGCEAASEFAYQVLKLLGLYDEVVVGDDASFSACRETRPSAV